MRATASERGTMSDGQFWHDVTVEAKEPEFRREFVLTRHQVRTVDTIINALDDARTTLGMTKTALARKIDMSDSALRRLLTARGGNPTLGTLARVATALGYRISLTPLDGDEKAEVAEALQ